jgi:hypothetical protein
MDCVGEGVAVVCEMIPESTEITPEIETMMDMSENRKTSVNQSFQCAVAPVADG